MTRKLETEDVGLLANVRVLRFDPAHDRAPYFDVFQLWIEPGMTVLAVLQRIKETQDATLTFRAACRSSICGSCAVRINGKPVLACSTQVLPTLVAFWKSSITITPLGNLPVLRDLVVDVEPVLDGMARLHPYVMQDPERVPESLEREALVSPRELRRFDSSTDCVLCGSCVSNCSTMELESRYAGPLALAKAYRFCADPRDGFRGPRLQAAQDGGLWSCAQCRKCVTVCPKDTAPSRSIQRLRKMSVDDGIVDTPGSKRAKAYTADVARLGQVNKPMLPVVVNGPRGWGAVEAEALFMNAHGVEHALEVPTLPAQPRAARIHERALEIEAAAREGRDE